MILPTTARATVGLCMPCWQKSGAWEESLKLEAARCRPASLMVLAHFRFTTTHPTSVVAGLTSLLKDCLLAGGVAIGELWEIAGTLDSTSRQLVGFNTRMNEMVGGKGAQDVSRNEVIEHFDEFGAILAALDQTLDQACSRRSEWPGNGGELLGILKEQVRGLKGLLTTSCDDLASGAIASATSL
jgi:hypothetical protein